MRRQTLRRSRRATAASRTHPTRPQRQRANANVTHSNQPLLTLSRGHPPGVIRCGNLTDIPIGRSFGQAVNSNCMRIQMRSLSQIAKYIEIFSGNWCYNMYSAKY